MARLEIKYPSSQVLNSRFCWVCGKIGFEKLGVMMCDNHDGGMVQWSVYLRAIAPLNSVIMFRTWTIPAVDFSSPGVHCSPA